MKKKSLLIISLAALMCACGTNKQSSSSTSTGGEITTSTSEETTSSEESTTHEDPVIHVESITLSETTLALLTGEEYTLVATVLPENADDKSYAWSSSNEEVVSVVEGKLTALKAGTTTIKATTTDGEHEATCVVTVSNIEVEEVTLEITDSTLKIGETIALNATVSPENATVKTVSYESNNTSVVTVDEEGVVTAIGLGNAIVTATSGTATATATFKVVSQNGIYDLVLDKDNKVDAYGNMIDFTSVGEVSFDVNDGYATLPANSEIKLTEEDNLNNIMSLQVFYEGEGLVYDVYNDASQEAREALSGAKMYFLNKNGYFALKNTSTEDLKITSIKITYAKEASDLAQYKFRTGDSSYWNIASDEAGVTTIEANYEGEEKDSKAFLLLENVKMSKGYINYQTYVDASEVSKEGDVKGFAVLADDNATYGHQHLLTGIYTAPTGTAGLNGRFMQYLEPTTRGETTSKGWAHTVNPEAIGALVKDKTWTDVSVKVEDALKNGKLVSTYVGNEYKSSSTIDLSCLTGNSVGLALTQNKAAVRNVVITSLDEATENVSKWDGVTTEMPAGDNSEASPYLITKASELAWVREEVNTAAKTVYLKLMADLDMGNAEWDPIGKVAATPFKGVFDGNGHTVKGLSMNRANSDKAAFIGFSDTATIKNLNLKVSFYSTGDGIGGAVANVGAKTIISDVTLKGFVRGTGTSAGAGGIATYAVSSIDSKIENCTNYATVINTAASGNTFIGGIIASTAGVFNITNNKNYGTVVAKANFVGGVSGLVRAGTGSTFSDNYNFGNVYGGGGSTGGVVGCMRINSTNSYCYANALINGVLASTLSACPAASGTTVTTAKPSYLFGQISPNASITYTGGLIDINGIAL